MACVLLTHLFPVDDMTEVRYPRFTAVTWAFSLNLSFLIAQITTVQLHTSLFFQLLVILEFRARKDLRDALGQCFFKLLLSTHSWVIKSASWVLLTETVGGGMAENPINIYLPNQSSCVTNMPHLLMGSHGHNIFHVVEIE